MYVIFRLKSGPSSSLLTFKDLQLEVHEVPRVEPLALLLPGVPALLAARGPWRDPRGADLALMHPLGAESEGGGQERWWR